MLAFLRFLAGFIPALGKLLDLLQGKVWRDAGRAEATLEQQEATNALTEKAVAARRDQRARNAEPDSLRQPDKYSRT